MFDGLFDINLLIIFIVRVRIRYCDFKIIFAAFLIKIIYLLLFDYQKDLVFLLAGL